MSINYCLPIMQSSQAEVMATIQRHEASYGFFEIWLDYITDRTSDFIPELTAQWPDRIVLLFRRQQLEPIKMPVNERLQIIDSLAGKPVLLDLDITSQQAELAHIAAARPAVPLITSYHNYESTPSDLQQIVDSMQQYQPHIVKLATYCTTRQDALRLLQLQLDLASGHQKHIILGMGPNGAITRIFGTLWGNKLIFAPTTSAQQSAPGQLTREQLERIFAEL